MRERLDAVKNSDIFGDWLYPLLTAHAGKLYTPDMLVYNLVKAISEASKGRGAVIDGIMVLQVEDFIRAIVTEPAQQIAAINAYEEIKNS